MAFVVLEKRIIMSDATKEKPIGYWMYDGQFYYKCSECGYNASFKYNFCPNCGSRNNPKKKRLKDEK